MDAKQEPKETNICPLCGTKFTGTEAEACAACQKLGRCSMVMCPNCGYEMPKER